MAVLFHVQDFFLRICLESLLFPLTLSCFLQIISSCLLLSPIPTCFSNSIGKSFKDGPLKFLWTALSTSARKPWICYLWDWRNSPRCIITWWMKSTIVLSLSIFIKPAVPNGQTIPAQYFAHGAPQTCTSCKTCKVTARHWTRRKRIRHRTRYGR